MATYKNKEIVKVAYYYYKLGMTQGEIAEKMSMSRQRVNRLLKKALEENIVQINIVDIEKYNFELEAKLEKKFNLKQCVVISTIDEEDIVHNLGIAGVEYLEGILKEGDLIGVTWGRTLSEVAKNLKTNEELNISAVQLVGGANVTYTSLKPDVITSTFAKKLGGQSHILYAPALVENKATKEAMMSDLSLKPTFDNMEKCNIMLVGIGELKEKTVYFNGEIDKVYKEHLISRSCIGDIGFRWFDRDGNIVDHEYDDNTIGYNILKRETDALVIGIAGGEEKREAILGALRGKFLDVLVTDSKTAEALISSVD